MVWLFLREILGKKYFVTFSTLQKTIATSDTELDFFFTEAACTSLLTNWGTKISDMLGSVGEFPTPKNCKKSARKMSNFFT